MPPQLVRMHGHQRKGGGDPWHRTGGPVIRGRVSFLMASLQRTVHMSGISPGHVIQARRLRRIARNWPVHMKTKKYPEAITAAILRKIGAIAEVQQKTGCMPGIPAQNHMQNARSN